MSGSGENTVNILLPNARVALFARDEDIRAAAASLKDDWRFARVTFDIYDGTVETAIDTYKQTASPNLMIVETDEIGAAFTERLEVLAGSCSEGTAAVVIGPVNDVYLYRRLIEMGVSDYLVRPIERQVLIELIAKILIEKLGAPGSKLIGVVGAKGGVGASAIAQMMAMVAARDLKQKTIILDIAGGRSYLPVALGTESVTTLHEACRASQGSDQDSFRRMIVKVGEHLSVLATGAEAIIDGVVTPEQFETLLNKLMVTYPVVVVDLSQGAMPLVNAVLERAHEIVIVSSPTLPSLRAVRGLLQEVKSLRGGADQGIHLIVNQKGASQGSEVSDQEIETALKLAPDMAIAWSPKIFGAAEATGKPLWDIPAVKDLWSLARKFVQQNLKISGETSQEEPAEQSQKILGGLLGKLKK